VGVVLAVMLVSAVFLSVWGCMLRSSDAVILCPARGVG
jgi:hypothetical protein